MRKNVFLFGSIYLDHLASSIEKTKEGGRACILVVILVYKAGGGGGGSQTSRRPIEGILWKRTGIIWDKKGGEKRYYGTTQI